MKNESVYKFLLRSSIIIVYALIFAGGLVRSTGSGMGCPDWPKCFGSYIPPIKESQLPINYKEIYKDHINVNEPFNAFKTWTEYLNRLLGALTGIVVLGLAFSSISQRKKSPLITFFSCFSLLMVLITAVVGAKVVSSNLATGKINIHLVLAFILVLGLIANSYFYKRTISYSNTEVNKIVKISVLILFGILLIQLFTGMETRSEIEEIQRNRDFRQRWEWVELAIHNFPTHRIFSIILTIITALVMINAWKLGKFADGYRRIVVILGTGLFGQVLTGTLLFKFGFPAFAQPFHILFATIMLGASFYLLLLLLGSNTLNEKTI